MKPLKEEKKHHSADEIVVSVSTRALNMTNHKLFTTRQKGITGMIFLDEGLQTHGTEPGFFLKKFPRRFHFEYDAFDKGYFYFSIYFS